MKILHISDLHFGPQRWEESDDNLLEKINSYNADIVINTGDSTSDGLEQEYRDAGDFLNRITCKYVISIIGNHDKRNMNAHDLFKEYIGDTEIIYPSGEKEFTKKDIFLDRKKTCIKDNYTDINLLKKINIDGKEALFIGIDLNLLYDDDGFIDESILDDLSIKMRDMSYDLLLLLIHHSLLGTNAAPLKNSQRVIDFINNQRIEYVFCGHTHELDLRKTYDLDHHQFIQFMCGATSVCNFPGRDNAFLFYENIGDDDFHMWLIRILKENNKLAFKDEKIF